MTRSADRTAARASTGSSISRTSPPASSPSTTHDRIVLVGQHRYTLGEDSWEIPEGGVGPAETPLEGVQRELREETGIEAADWRELCRLDLSNSVTDERAILFTARDLRHGEAAPDPSEAIEMRWVPFDEALAMTRDGRITDAMSVAAIQRVALDRADGG